MTALGEILCTSGHVTDTQLSQALAIQRKNGSRLGDILIANGAIGYYDLYQAVARHHGLPFVNLLSERPNTHLLANGIPPETLLARQVMPWKRDKAGNIIVAVTECNDDTVAWCRKQFGADVTFAITSPFDIRRTVEQEFGDKLETASRLTLWQRFPHISARITLLARQKQFAYGITLVALALTALFPLYMALAFIVFCHLTYAATMLFKCLIFAKGTAPIAPEHWPEKLEALDERSLPIYTILIPMYREAASLPGMLDAMRRMDYPASKLDIKLVLEADDRETLNAAYQLKPHYHFDIIRVPPHAPRTKPKACNYALRYARGELVTIFDADDRPDPKQLKKAVVAFRSLPKDVVCLQARLNYYNANDNLLTRFFSLEYTTLFHFMLYGLERLGIPLPLGGTSNHIALARLKELGEWDPYNVTEDADLGTRLAARGAKTRMLDSYTMEEAPNQIMPWIKQRSRWIKGFMQTWLVHMRHPRALYRSLGVRGFIGFQFFIGLSCFTFLTAPIVWALSLLWIASMVSWHHFAFPLWLMWFTGFNLVLNITTHWYLALYSALHYRKYKTPMAIAALLYPLYLLLHSIASYKALWQLFVKPHFWEKTTHGLAKYTDLSNLEQEMVLSRAVA